MTRYEQLRDQYFRHFESCGKCGLHRGYKVRYFVINPCQVAVSILSGMVNGKVNSEVPTEPDMDLYREIAEVAVFPW